MSSIRKVAVNLELDTTGFITGMKRMAAASRRSEQILRNDPVWVAGLEARYYVRGAMDPMYATPWARDALVFAILSGLSIPALQPRNRALVAAAVVRGWVTHRPAATRPRREVA